MNAPSNHFGHIARIGSSRTRALLGTIIVLALVLSGTVSTRTGMSVAALDERGEMVLGYAVPGACGGLSADGTRLAAGTGVYEVATGERRFAVQAWSARFSPDGATLLVSEAAMYEAATGELRLAMGQAWWLDFSPDGTLLAVDGAGAGVYEIATGERRFTIKGEQPRFSPDGTLLVVASDGLYEVATGERRFAIEGDRVRFSPDGTALVIGEHGVYEVATGERRFAIEESSGWQFSPDGTLLAVTQDGLYEVATGERRFTIGGWTLFSPDGTLLAVSQDGLYEVATGKRRLAIGGWPEQFSPDGTLLVVDGEGVYDVVTGDRRFPFILRHWQDFKPTWDFSPDGTLLAVASDGVYNVATGERRFAFEKSDPDSSNTYVQFSPDGTLLLVGDWAIIDDAELPTVNSVYGVATGERRFAFSKPASGYFPYVDFNPDGTLLVVGSDGVYDTATGERRFAIEGDQPLFSPDGALLLDGTLEDVLYNLHGVYEVATGQRRAIQGYLAGATSNWTLLAAWQNGVYDVATGQRRFAISMFEGDEGALFSPDETLLVVGDEVFEVATGEHRFTIEAGESWGGESVFSPDGTLLAVEFTGVYDVATGERRFTFEGFDPVFSPDGTLLAVNGDGIYDVATGERRFVIEYPEKFSPDGTLLASGDGIYDVASGERRFDIEGYYAAFSADGTLLAVPRDGVYDMVTGERRFAIQGWDLAVFSPDGTLLAVPDDGMYDAATGERRFAIQGWDSVAFSPDGTLLAVPDDGMYDVATGERLAVIENERDSWAFSSEGALLAVTSAALGAPCAIWGTHDYPWPYRSGQVATNGRIAIYGAPSSDAPVLVDDYQGELIVFARTADDQWYKVFEDGENAGWVSAGDVMVTSMPEGVPVENPNRMQDEAATVTPEPIVRSTPMPASSSEPYNETAIAQEDIERALANAQADGRLVLLDFGANWCPDCVVLSTLLEDPSVQPYLQDNFHVVKIDVGEWDKNLDISQHYGSPIDNGIPAVVVLAPNGDVIATTKDGALANARTATARDILGYLEMWVAQKP